MKGKLIKKIFASILVASIVTSMPIAVKAESDNTVNDNNNNIDESKIEKQSVYTTNEDFDKGIMTGVSYHDINDELCLSK